MDLPDEAAARVEAHNVADGLAVLQRGFGGRPAGGRVVVIDEDGVEISRVGAGYMTAVGNPPECSKPNSVTQNTQHRVRLTGLLRKQKSRFVMIPSLRELELMTEQQRAALLKKAQPPWLPIQRTGRRVRYLRC
jgi:hypothetical protein